MSEKRERVIHKIHGQLKLVTAFANQRTEGKLKRLCELKKICTKLFDNM